MAHDPNDLYEIPKGHTSFASAAHRMSIDGKNQLFWNGKPIKTDITVPWIAKVFALVLGLATVAGGIGGFVQGYVAYRQWSDQSQKLSEPDKKIKPTVPE